MSILVPHLLVLLSGICLFPFFSKVNFSLISRIAICYLCGELVLLSFFVFCSFVFGYIFWNGAWFIALIGTVILGKEVWPSLRRISRGVHSFRDERTILLVLQLLLVALNFSNFDTSFLLPAVAWDARSIWLFHGKIFYYANSIDLGALKNPEYLWSHPDYPPFIPLLAAYHSQFLSGWSEILSKSFLFVHWSFCLILLAQLLFNLCKNFLVVAAISVLIQLLFSNNCHIAYADSCCAMALGLAVICLALDLSESNSNSGGPRPVYWMGICCLALAALMKNEGLIFGGVIYLVHFIFSRAESKSLAAELKGLVTFFVLVAPWYFIVWYYEIKGEYSSFHLSSGSLNWNELSTRLSTILGLGFASIVKGHGVSAIFILLLAIVVSAWRQFFVGDRVERYLLSLALILLLALIPIYALTPLDLAWHIETSFARVSSTSIFLSCVLLCRIAR